MNRKTKTILIAILFLSFFLRAYNFKSYYVFSHDQDLASWIAKDILINGHFRLIGQETSSQGVFIGALFYYLQIPFYLLGKMDPLATVFLPIILAVFATYSIFFVFSKIANTKVGLIGAFIYATSALIVFVDREVVPTMPVMLWTIWYLYCLFLIYKNKYLKGFVLSGLLIGLIWHLNLSLILLTPLVLFAFLFSKRKFNIKALSVGFLILFLSSLPLIVFESRHNFSQTKAVILSLTTKKDFIEGTSTGFAKLDRVMQLVNKNSMAIFTRHYFVHPSVAFILLFTLLIYFIKVKKINLFFGTMFILWLGLYIFFFTLNPKNPSEYYFNGINIIWIFVASLGLLELKKTKIGLLAFYILVSLFVITNMNYIIKYNPDKKGYIQKMDLVSEIKNDSLKHNYPCVSVSYITNPGYDLGYRYLFYMKAMHVNRPISGSPVYTIVYPHNLVNSIDKAFGSLGLIYPDYDRYNKEEVEKSCVGENSNLTDPMFGYTQ